MHEHACHERRTYRWGSDQTNMRRSVALVLFHIFDGLGDAIVDELPVACQNTADRSQFHAMRRALHEFCVKFAFDLADLLADGRLRPAGFARDRGERTQTFHIPQGHQNLRVQCFRAESRGIRGDADVGVRVGVFARVAIGWSVHMRVVLSFLGMRGWPRPPHSLRGTCVPILRTTCSTCSGRTGFPVRG